MYIVFLLKTKKQVFAELRQGHLMFLMEGFYPVNGGDSSHGEIVFQY